MMKLVFITLIIFVILSCSEEPLTNVVNGDWLIPKREVHDGGPGKDGIPSIDNPKMISLENTDFLNDDDLVVLFGNQGELSIYPHKILDWHEIVNAQDVVVSYCPLTGTAIGLNREIEQNGLSERTAFGVSGLLYNTNLILYDRLTDSYWSQMKNQCVGGDLIGTFPKNEILVETTYKTVKNMFQDARVLSDKTGYYSTEQYAVYPYGDYKTNNNRLLFPISNSDNRIPGKERVMGIVINGEARAYRFESLESGINVINTNVGGVEVVVVGSKTSNYLVAYKNTFNDSQVPLTFTKGSGNGQVVFKDNIGNNYNVLGEVVTGPNSGSRLAGTHSYISFWFAWAAFYPNTEIK
ncbi:MAG: DUF3179 domain-containing protein [Calditrichaeota bacterium]|nr:MAG: DUF3179 domain-containing protein [Calditrichota bacterium]MBL1203915.1 DUF3179 domain-containing protein [Calditrichota bacterium]NOG43748.1 DUF3179 domain-containing protein [Calditrichota bacterium]